MTDNELMLATIDAMRATRNPALIDILSEVQRRLQTGKLERPKNITRTEYMRLYMRAYRNRKRATNPFDNA